MTHIGTTDHSIAEWESMATITVHTVRNVVRKIAHGLTGANIRRCFELNPNFLTRTLEPEQAPERGGGFHSSRPALLPVEPRD